MKVWLQQIFWIILVSVTFLLLDDVHAQVGTPLADSDKLFCWQGAYVSMPPLLAPTPQVLVPERVVVTCAALHMERRLCTTPYDLMPKWSYRC
jgi:hypothetical protein